MDISRIVVGTAQFGMQYGIANRTGVPDVGEVVKIVATAWEHGVHFFDTAQAYGWSEARLGEALRSLGVQGQAAVISKLNPSLDPRDPRAILRSVEDSCVRLGVPSLWGILVHRAEWLEAWDDGLGQALRQVRRAGLAQFVGVSVYTEKPAKAALLHADIDIIQAPANAWDQRLLRHGIFELAAAHDKLCFVRSVYLQGLLVLSPGEVRERLPRALPAAERWHRIAADYGVPPAALAMRFALSLGLPLVIGVERSEQLQANLVLAQQPPLGGCQIDEIAVRMANVLNDYVLNPSFWK